MEAGVVSAETPRPLWCCCGLVDMTSIQPKLLATTNGRAWSKAKIAKVARAAGQFFAIES